MHTDLPAGYRWATEDEAEAFDAEANPRAILVTLTVDSNGYRYHNGEADYAVPITKGA